MDLSWLARLIGNWISPEGTKKAEQYYNSAAEATGLSNMKTDIFSGLWNDVTGKSNTIAQNNAAAALQEDAQEHQKEVLQNSHQWEVQDLQNAGLNPWLSAGNGVTSGSAGIAASQASNVNPLASIGTAAAGIGILIKAVKAATK